MVEKKSMYLESDTLFAQRTEDEKNWSEFGELAQEAFKDFTKNTDGTSGVEAKSFQDAGRNCVQCSDILTVFEEFENGNILLQCVNGHKQWNGDIMAYSKEELKEMNKLAKAEGASAARYYADELYRDIPDSLIIRYTEMREKSRQGY